MLEAVGAGSMALAEVAAHNKGSLFTFRAPEEPGSHLLEWDPVSEGERWFAECGSRSARVPLRVTEHAR
jgi:hypothetical protein